MLIPKCHLFHHEEHEGLEGIAAFTSYIFIETPHKATLFNSCFNNFTLNRFVSYLHTLHVLNGNNTSYKLENENIIDFDDQSCSSL